MGEFSFLFFHTCFEKGCRHMGAKHYVDVAFGVRGERGSGCVSRPQLQLSTMLNSAKHFLTSSNTLITSLTFSSFRHAQQGVWDEVTGLN